MLGPEHPDNGFIAIAIGVILWVIFAGVIVLSQMIPKGAAAY